MSCLEEVVGNNFLARPVYTLCLKKRANFGKL